MKLTSIYYSPSLERITVCSLDDILALDHDFMLNVLLNFDYELIGYFNESNVID